MSREKTFVNVIVMDGNSEGRDFTPVQFALIGQIKLKIAETMSIVVGAVDQSRAQPGSCHPHALLLTALGQLYANALHFLSTTEHRTVFAEELQDLFENLSREVEKAETVNEGGGTA